MFLSSPSSVRAVGPADMWDFCRLDVMQYIVARWKGGGFGEDPNFSCADVSRVPELILGGGCGNPDVKFERASTVNNEYPLGSA